MLFAAIPRRQRGRQPGEPPRQGKDIMDPNAPCRRRRERQDDRRWRSTRLTREGASRADGSGLLRPHLDMAPYDRRARSAEMRAGSRVPGSVRCDPRRAANRQRCSSRGHRLPLLGSAQGTFEWSYREEDTDGIKMAEYAIHGVEKQHHGDMTALGAGAAESTLNRLKS